jgi:hypothetical protein
MFSQIKWKESGNYQKMEHHIKSPPHTFPSITDTHELVVPRSIPITSFPVGFALRNKSTQKAYISTLEESALTILTNQCKILT